MLILGGSYFFANLTIFERTFIQLNTSQKVSYIPFENKPNMQCDKVDGLMPKLTSSHFRLVNWNVHKGQDKGWQEDLARLSKQADFVLLQEANAVSKFKYIFRPHFLCPLFLLKISYQV